MSFFLLSGIILCMAKSTDVIIVGAGLAGLMCAYELANSDVNVTIIYQGDLEHTSSYYAQGGLAAAFSSNDSVEDHVRDTLFAGDGLCEESVVRYFCGQAPQLIETLIHCGVPFDKNDNGDYQLTKEGAHSFERIFHVKDHTGFSIIQTLVQYLKSVKNIAWINASVQGILQSSNTKRIHGVIVNGDSIISHATVLATGGFSNLFSTSTNPKKNIGEGIALAFMAGAQLADLEFIQFHPTVYCADGFPPLLISEALRGEGAFLVNKNNDRFMKRYHQLQDLAPRDVVARAIFQEIEPKLNIAPLMPTIEQRFPTIYRSLIDRGFKVDDYEIPVQPLVHYTLGGIVAGINGETSLDGLYAIGECAVTGFHGANRLASNSLLEAGLMGQTCGKILCQHEFNPQIERNELDSILIPSLTSSSLLFLGNVCREHLGVIRDESSLRMGIEQLESSSQPDHPLFAFLKAVLESALFRNESRGGHFRTDTPNGLNQASHSVIDRHHELLHLDQLF